MKLTDEMKDFLRETRPGRNWREVSELFEGRFGITLTKWQVRNQCARIGVKACEQTRSRCFETPNSGKYAVGDEMEYRGNVWVKVASGGSTGKSRSLYKSGLWEKKQNLVWEKANGRKLPEGHVVMFADGDRGNYDPDNLVAVPADIASAVNGMHGLNHDRETFDVCVAIARIRKAMRRKREAIA